MYSDKFSLKKLEKTIKYVMISICEFHIYFWPIGEMVNTLPSQGNIYGFEPRIGHQMKKGRICFPWEMVSPLLSYLSNEKRKTDRNLIENRGKFVGETSLFRHIKSTKGGRIE